MSDWEQTQLRGGNTVVQAPRSPSSQGHQSSSINMLATPGPHPLPEYLKQIGAHVSALAASEYSGAAGSAVNPRGVHSAHFITPLLASFVARALTLEAEEAAASRGENSEYTIVSHVMGSGSAGAGTGGHVSQSINLTPETQDRLIQSTLHRLHQLDDPLLETLKMQVAFESLYASEIQRKRQTNYNLDQANSAQLARIMEIGTNISSNAQVASLYRAIFKLMLANGCVDSPAASAAAATGAASTAAASPAPVADRNIDREIAAALESVFPQSGLNAFNTLASPDKKSQILNLINIVLGIRLFNRDIKKGGAGLIDVPGLAAAEVEALYEDLEKESSIVGEICFTYSDVLQLERNKPGSISASVLRLQAELINRRQYILLIHQLQHEVLESLDLIADSSRQFTEACAELRTLVGLRTSVPKEQIYPKFQSIAMLWRLLIEEREMNGVRLRIFQSVLLKYRQSFASNLLEEDISLLKREQTDPKAVAADAERQKREQAIDFDEFVETIVAPEAAAAEGPDAAAAAAAAASYRPVRLLKDHTPNFMSLPLEYQGYCPWALVHLGGLLLPGNPSLGIIRVLGRHYTFSSVESLREFCEDPEKYIAGVLVAARRNPALIHLLCLQPYILHSDISELFSLDSMISTDHSAAATQKSNASCQTPSGVINTSIPDPNYHWNEWDLRRKAIQLADLTNKKTVSAQTNLSHFRRDNGTQYTLPEMAEDGSMEGKATQTGVEKSSQVERVYRYHAGLRGKPDKGPADPGAKMRVVELRVPTHVEDATNGNLQLKPNESLKTYIVRDRQR